MQPVARLIEIIEEIAKGNYSNDVMSLTTEDNPEFVRNIAEAMGMMMVKVEAREYELEEMVERLRELNRQIKENTIKTVSAMAHALAARDAYTEGHTARVGELARRMARHMGLDEETVESVRLGGILHDIGKIGFPDPLFQAHGGHNPPEMVKVIVRHPDWGRISSKTWISLGPLANTSIPTMNAWTEKDIHANSRPKISRWVLELWRLRIATTP